MQSFKHCTDAYCFPPHPRSFRFCLSAVPVSPLVIASVLLPLPVPFASCFGALLPLFVLFVSCFGCFMSTFFVLGLPFPNCLCCGPLVNASGFDSPFVSAGKFFFLFGSGPGMPVF